MRGMTYYQVDPHAHQGSVPAGADLHVLHLRSSVGETQHALRARLEPSDRTAEALGSHGGDEIFGIDLELRPEAPAHVGGDRPDGRLVDAERGRQVVTDVERHLRRDPDRVRAVGPGHHGDAVRLQRHRRDPLVHEPSADDDRSTLERIGSLRIGPELVRDVRSVRRPQQGRAVGGRGLDVDHGVERLEIDGHLFGCILRVSEGLGDDHRDRFADEPNDIACEHVAGEQAFDRAGGALDVPARRQRRKTEVAGGEDGLHSRHRARPRDLDAQDARVGHRRANEHRTQGPLDLNVLEEPALPSEQPRILGSAHGDAEHRRRHRRHGPMLSTASRWEDEPWHAPASSTAGSRLHSPSARCPRSWSGSRLRPPQGRCARIG